MTKEHSQYNLTQDELSEIPVFAPLSRKQEIYLNDKENDIIIWGGAASSGKSYLSALDMLVNGMEDKHYRAGVVRRMKEQLKGAGSLYDEMSNMYATFGVKPKGQAMEFEFESGAFIKMTHSDRPHDKHNFQGWQVTSWLVDEAQQLNEENVVYLLSRLRSKSKQHHQLKLTCNPQYESFLRVWLEKAGYIDENGLPRKEMDGVTTYMAEISGETVFLPTLKDFIDKYGKELIDDLEPMKIVFYSANVNDNPWICKYNKSYVAKLKNLPRIERMRLYEGSWYAKEEAAGVIKRDWFQIVSSADVPAFGKTARAWDKAGTLPSTMYPDPDFTVGLKGKLDDKGNLFVIDMKRFRDRPAIVQREIEKSAHEDGADCYVGIPKDPGAAGKEVTENLSAILMKQGRKPIVNQTNKSKAVRFEPVAIAAQNRQIFVVKGDWNEDFFKELETLDFNIRKTGHHDDIADALSDLWTMLTAKFIVPVIDISGSKRTMARTNTLL